MIYSPQYKQTNNTTYKEMVFCVWKNDKHNLDVQKAVLCVMVLGAEICA